MGRSQQCTLQIICPAMYGANDISAFAAALEQQRLPMAANVGQQFDAACVAHQHFGIIHPFRHIIVAYVRNHHFMADIAGTRSNKKRFSKSRICGIEIPLNRQLRRCQLRNIKKIGHIGYLTFRGNKDSWRIENALKKWDK